MKIWWSLRRQRIGKEKNEKKSMHRRCTWDGWEINHLKKCNLMAKNDNFLAFMVIPCFCKLISTCLQEHHIINRHISHAVFFLNDSFVAENDGVFHGIILIFNKMVQSTMHIIILPRLDFQRQY